MAGLELLGPCGWWSEGVRIARWTATGGETLRVAAVLGPESDAGALNRARERAASWIGRSEPGVVRLLDVVAAQGRRVAWVYEDTGSVSLATLFTAVEPSHRLAAEIVAAVADVLDPLAASGRVHPGLSSDDVLVSPVGEVAVAGFVSPFARAPVHREPRGAEDSTAVVWRLGVLLAEILTGVPPTPATDRAGHELMLRRLLIRVMSRPGPLFSERYRDWLTGMLAWEADQRPPLHRVAPALRELAAASVGEDLRSQCERAVPDLRRRTEHIDAPTVIEPSLEILPAVPFAGSEKTEEVAVSPEFEDAARDDETAISHDADPAGPSVAPPEYGTIPVGVGPPPQAVPRPARLPDELFASTDPSTSVSAREEGPNHWYIAGAASAALGFVAILLAWYLIF